MGMQTSTLLQANGLVTVGSRGARRTPLGATTSRRVVHRIERIAIARRDRQVQRTARRGVPRHSPSESWRFEAVMHMARRRPYGAIIVPIVLVFTAACSTGPESQPPASTSSASTSSPTTTPPTPLPDPSESASAAALASYAGFWSAQVSSQAHPTRKQDANLAKYATDKALAGAQQTIFIYRQNGIAMLGEPTLSPTVTAVALTSPPKVSIQDCVDTSKWRPVYVATGKSALAPGQSPRVVVESTATTFGGRWVIDSSVVHRDQPC